MTDMQDKEVEVAATNGQIRTVANLWYSKQRTYGAGSRACRKCGNSHGIIRKYSLNICRRCFRENAEIIGFKKF